MTIEEAHRIAAAQLGPALHNVTRGGPNGDEWLVQAVPPTGPLLSARAAVLEEAIVEADAQLRAAGWVPTHPRLEWESNSVGDNHTLWLRLDNYEQLLFAVRKWSSGRYSMYVCHTPDERGVAGGTLAEVMAPIAEWCAANLPSLHLPPFPGASDAS